MVSVQRFVNLKDVPQERKDHSIEVDENWPSKGVVEFKNVTLKYRPTTEAVLRNLSFVVQAGMKVGVVGRTGAGKSTICISLSRIVELFEEYKNDDDDLGSRQRSGSWLSSTTSKSQNSKPVSKVF